MMTGFRKGRLHRSSEQSPTEQDCMAGKVTAAVAGAQTLLAASYWESVFWADLSGCTTPPSVTFALLAAFGIPAEAPETNPLQVPRRTSPHKKQPGSATRSLLIMLHWFKLETFLLHVIHRTSRFSSQWCALHMRVGRDCIV